MVKKKLKDLAFKGTVIAIPLFREATEHEFSMVEKYIEKNFGGNVGVSQKSENGCWSIFISGELSQAISQWVVEILNPFLQADFPQDWIDSLDQFVAGTGNSLKLMNVPKSDQIWRKVANLFDSAS